MMRSVFAPDVSDASPSTASSVAPSDTVGPVTKALGLLAVVGGGAVLLYKLNQLRSPFAGPLEPSTQVPALNKMLAS